jgi:hypothetical protein
MRIYLATPRLRGLLALNLASAAASAMVIVNTVVLVQARFGLAQRETAFALAAFGMLSAGASAQEITQRPVRTEKITGAPAGVGLYEIGPDGTVLIDWRAVEAAANGLADRMSAPVAQVMLAIRDAKWIANSEALRSPRDELFGKV